MAVSAAFSTCTCIEELLARITKVRRSEFTIGLSLFLYFNPLFYSFFYSDPEDFTVVTPSDKQIWTKMFQEYFITNRHCTLPHCAAHQADDMLWYVRHNVPSSFYLGASVCFSLYRTAFIFMASSAFSPKEECWRYTEERARNIRYPATLRSTGKRLCI